MINGRMRERESDKWRMRERERPICGRMRERVIYGRMTQIDKWENERD